MFVVQAFSRGAIAFFVIMSLGVVSLQLRDGVSVSSLDGLFDADVLMASVDSIKGSLMRTLNGILQS